MSIRRPLPYVADSCIYFERLRTMGDAVFLDSGRPGSPYGRFDILAAAPVEQLIYSYDPNQGEQPFEALRALYARYDTGDTGDPDLPFCGGLIGHFSYDLGRALENLPEQAIKDTDYPEMIVGAYLWAVVVDHKLKRCTLVAADTTADATGLKSVDNSQLDAIEQRLLTEQNSTTEPFQLTAPFHSNVTEAQYHAALKRVDEYIHAGDCYQVNFAQRFSSQFSGDPWQAYRRLRRAAPVPYAAYLETRHGSILSLSPEQFLEVNEGEVTTKPIKGTRPRSADPTEDAALKAELKSALKDRAENLMIVDLLRNDLSKVCEHGSVRVPRLFAVESYSNVHHLVTTVTGRLEKRYSPIDLLEHCFPGGSITGAPKIRAMEIIEELEPHRRSVYCGSIGYLSFCGRMDTSITIRTLLCEAGQIHCWAGGGIVADSESAMEYEETFNKVNNLLHTLEAND